MVGEMEKIGSVKKNLFFNTIKTLMGIIYPLITFPYVSRILEPEGIGKYNFAQSIINYFTMLASLGLAGYGIREVAKIRNDKLQLSKFVKEILVINIVTTTLAYIIFILAIMLVPKLSDYRNLLLVLCASIFFTNIGVSWFYSGIEDFKYITIRSVCFQIITFILLFVIVRNKTDIYKYAFLTVIANTGANLCNFIHLRKYITVFPRIKLEIKKHLKPILIFFTIVAANQLYSMIDSVMLGTLRGDYELGIYTVGLRINFVVQGLLCSMMEVLLPRVSFATNENNSEYILALQKKATNLFYILVFPAMTGLFVISKPIIALFFGELYTASVPVMKIACLIVFFVSTSVYLTNVFLIPNGCEKKLMITSYLSMIVNILMNLVLIPLYGAVGAIIATVITEGIIMLSKLLISKKYIKFKIVFKNIWQYFLAALLMALIVHLISNCVFSPLYSILISIVTAACVYFCILRFLKNEYLEMLINQIFIKYKKLRNEK